MAIGIANTELTNTFDFWRARTNEMSFAFQKRVLTGGTGGIDDTANGNAILNGALSANNLYVLTNIRGGTRLNEGTLTLLSNTSIDGVDLTVSANTVFTGNVAFNASGNRQVDLGIIDDIKISGGPAGRFMQTDGSTNISWVQPDFSDFSGQIANSQFLSSVGLSSLVVSDIKIGGAGANTMNSVDNTDNLGGAGASALATSQAIKAYVDNATGGASGNMASQNSDNVNVTGGAIVGITDLLVSDGGTGSSSASGARTNLGLGALAVQDTVAPGDLDDDQIINGDVIFDTDTLYVEGSTNRVGVNTLSPEQPLSVQGNTLVGSMATTTMFVNGESRRVGIRTSNPLYPLHVSGNVMIGSASVPTLYVEHKTRKIGIKTASPAHPLHVVGNTLIGTDTIWADTTNQRVGINRTNPSTATNLDVNGKIKASTGLIGNNAVGARTVSTGSPTGGNNGDVWYKY